MLMLKEKLISTIPREDAGSRSSNRFAYQHSWALSKLLDIYDSGKDFAIILDYFDDIVILDSSDNPSSIDFYQIKTNTKSSDQYISTKKLIEQKKTGKGDGQKVKPSFMEKLIDNFNNFPDQTNSLNFISNKFFKIKIEEKKFSVTHKSVALHEIHEDDLNTIQSNMCKSCHKYTETSKCDQNCKDLIVFSVSDLSTNNHEETLIGIVSNFFLNKNVPQLNAKAATDALLSQIRIKNNDEFNGKTVGDLLERKSISKHEFHDSISKLIKINCITHNWAQINNLLVSEGISFKDSKEIRSNYEKYFIDRTSEMNLYDSRIIEIIRDDIEILNSNKIIEHFNSTIPKLRKIDGCIPELYSDSYLKAMILMELYS